MRLPLLPLFLAVLLGGCGPKPGAPDSPTDASDALVEARMLLDTDRPWSAARLLRQIGDDDLSAEARLLAARAEAGARDWPRVRALLDGAEGLDSLEGGRGRYLLARAYDNADDLDAARAGYDAFLSVADTTQAVERGAARLRRALVLARLDAETGDRALDAITEVSPEWRAVLAAEALARDGRTDRVEALAGSVSGGERGRRMDAARIEAAQRSGDLAAARRLADRARSRADSDAARAAFALTAGRLAEAMGDAEARALFRDAIDEAPASPAARDAAQRLRQGTPTADDWLALARTDRALGLNAEAADAFGQWIDSEWRGASVGTPAQREDIRFEAADALFDAQRYDDALAMLKGPNVAVSRPARVRALMAGAYGRMGRTDQAAAIYLELAEDDVRHLYFAADVLHQGGDLDRALPLYRRVEQEAPGSAWAGLAVLRRAGQAFLAEDYAEAAALWDGYRGTDALRARYWAGRAHAAAGDSAAAADRFREVLRRERDSYYALLASEALGEPFWPLPLSPSPPADAAADARVAEALRGVDVLREAGFPEVAEAEADRVIAGAGREQADRYALAEALIARGYGRRAILLGQGLGGGTNARRLRILYPFPFRRMIEAEARASGVDPFTAAALIRQESQFSARATSYVGARGLMQLMPATGRTLATEVGIDDWDPALLYLPEVNVHLGTRYVGQQVEAYGGSLPAVFGAYNAGPHQVDAWRAFPEFGRAALFTERIPFRETRDYVKILTRNRAIYQGLYGTDSARLGEAAD
ncbi:hypothetical protein B1759_14155 [Rubrivirga sp. SAORIC476]|uniref:transglycosylase SLT domain-containing protein n=1 Tax=Rubrivirga sp. SAORIC476 TaxID=1961794 RepID=UPI000BA9BD19|nr:transglycosylase SLT domain-containing protein [Rubrivirga sp. SAORIC476]PAP79463.1 hypothetical protein B1759_14155 [Rubrivirga sp. SAORIC476]